MKRLLLTVPLFFLLASSAFAITAQEEQLIVRNALAVLGQTSLELPDTIPVKRICGTAAIMEAKLRFNELSLSAQAALRPLLSARPLLQKIYDTPSGHFRIHYDTTGSDAVRNAAIRNGQGIPVWVDTLAMVLDSIWVKEVTQMGFRAPVGDSFYTPNGGDGRLDVYLENLGLGLGLTFPDSAGGVLGNRATAFIILDNDYNTFPYNNPLYGIGPSGAMRVTTAHEFFHAVQFAYNVFGFEVVSGNGMYYWQEATATWMEDQMYNEINDYSQYLLYWFRAPELSFRSFSSDFFNPDPNVQNKVFRPYALGIYGHYLSKRFPNPSYGYSVVRRVWERMATVSGFNLFAAIDFALASEGSNFLSSLQEFYRWNYFVGPKVPINAPDTLYGSEAAIWPTFEVYDRVDTTDVYPTRFPKPYAPCQPCPPSAIAFFCAPCSTIAGSPCLTDCAPICPFVPFQLFSSFACINDVEDLGASYLTLQNVNRSSAIIFDLIADSRSRVPWFAAGGGYDLPNRTLDFLGSDRTDPSGQINELIFDDIGNYTEVVVTIVNDTLLPAGSARRSSTYAYSATDSSVPPGFTRILDPRPNPFRTGITEKVFFPVDLDSLAGDWEISITIFSPAGEIVFTEEKSFRGGVTYKTKLGWNGENESGVQVASGIYFCKVIMKEIGKSRKVEKVLKIALIRQ